MKKITVKELALYAVVAALYAAFTVATSAISYQGVQFRLSEVLVLLCFFNKKYFIPLTLGCAVANLFSPFGVLDVAFGTLATALSLIGIMFSKKLWVASIFPVFINGVIVGLEIFLFFTPTADQSITTFFMLFGGVVLGEFVCVSIVGVLLFTHLRRNKGFMELIEANQNLSQYA